ncbi:class II histocompatibility antigen, M alpha chain [Hyperolius riggenbachi]|uniref:class II histocompatibility antigen, M alpha chain n=1 Tax=Hyperolius riggenbachi TaxID=752182 RepID=UPI0035A2F0D9
MPFLVCVGSVRVLHVVVLLLPLLVVQAEDRHLLSQVLFCQPGEPTSGLLQMFDVDQMFSYNFSDASTKPWLREFEQWDGQAFPMPDDISSRLAFCKNFSEVLTKTLTDIMPEARGGTQVSVFTAQPLHIGKPNTLICSISDVFPPALTITWRKDGKILSTELNTNAYLSMYDQSFQAFSYLNVTPAYDVVYSCNVQVAGDSKTIVGYWVPDYPVPSDILENSLCGLVFSLGIIFLLVGGVFLYLAFRSRDAA